jgi:hypothetical protein
MIIVAGGDSFIFGAELQDQNSGPSASTYPALLAKQHNFDYYCAARSGNANNAISRMTMTECERLRKDNDVFALVMWTFTNRYEFRFNYNTKQSISPWYSINAWSILDNTDLIEKEFKSKNNNILNHQKENIKTANKTGVANFAKTFFMHVGDNEYYELYSSLKEILFLQNYFKQNSIPYLFLPADNHFYQHPTYYRRQDEYIDAIYNQIDWDKWFFFEKGKDPGHTHAPRGFYQWAVEHKYPVGTTHPLEAAHSAAANLIKDKFNELVTQSI